MNKAEAAPTPVTAEMTPEQALELIRRHGKNQFLNVRMVVFVFVAFGNYLISRVLMPIVLALLLVSLGTAVWQGWRIRRANRAALKELLAMRGVHALNALVDSQPYLAGIEQTRVVGERIHELYLELDEISSLEASEGVRSFFNTQFLRIGPLGQWEQGAFLRKLHAVQLFGDAGDLGFVRRCASLEGERSYQRAIREKAKQVLPVLEARLEAAKNTSALLRPAEQPQTDSLLRPAGAGVGEEERLLRVVEDQDSLDQRASRVSRENYERVLNKVSADAAPEPGDEL